MDNWKTWGKEELEKQMSPSRWNPKKTADEVISQHVAFCSDETQRARKIIPHQLDISYGTSDKQTYDLYGTDLPDEAMFVFWIHGGYWQEGSKDIAGTLTQNLYKNGVKTIVLGYTLAPQASIQEIQGEVYMALSKAMQGNKQAKFIVGGHSAGAQLAAQLLHENPKHDQPTIDVKQIVGFILFSGVYDLRPLVSTYINDALKLTRNDAESLSPLQKPLLRPSDQTKFILVCVGDFDSPEFLRQSQMYAEKLKGVYENVKLWISLQDDHFTLIERLACTNFDEPSPAKYVLNYLRSINLLN